MNYAEIIATVDTGFGLMGLFLVLRYVLPTQRRIARRLGLVESRVTPPPGTMATITDIKSGPVRNDRAKTAPF